MSDEKDTSEDKQAESPEQLRAEQQEKLKKKLEGMGVMRDDHSAPDEDLASVRQKSPLMKSGLTALLGVIVAVSFWWWYDSAEQTTTVADNGSSQATLPYSFPGGPPPDSYPRFDYPPPAQYPYGAVPPPVYAPAEDNVNKPASDALRNGSPDAWGYSGNWHGSRADDRFGPPPGWRPYGPSPAPGYYGSPPPPFYGQYQGQAYFGPGPYYMNPYNGGYYGPPPPGYMGYMPGY